MIDVSISVKTEQRDVQGNKDIIEVEYQGNMYKKNEDTYIIYKEKLGHEDELVTTTIKVNENEIAIKRFGTVKSNMIFNENKKYSTRYYTVQGVFEMEIKTSKLNIIKNITSLVMNIEYDMNVIGLFEGFNNIEIKVIENK